MEPRHIKKAASLSSPSCLSLCQPGLSCPLYSQVSAYRSSKLELHIYSPSVKVQKANRIGGNVVPVFTENDGVEGKVILDPSCHHSGVVSITVEGALRYRISPESTDPVRPTDADGKHVFLSTSTTMTVFPNLPPRPTTPFRSAFMGKQLSVSSIPTNIVPAERIYPFSIRLPRAETLPPTIASFTRAEGSVSEEFEISYTVIADWQPNDTPTDSPSKLEVPIHFEPKNDDSFPPSHEPWLEMPLRSDHPVSYRCAVTLPTSITFPRGTSLPFFVVFTTQPRSPALAREIATDAAVSVFLLRKITMADQVILPPTPPETPVSASHEIDNNKSNILRNVRSFSFRPKTPQKASPDRYQLESPSTPIDSSSSSPCPFREKPLPRLPTQTVFTNTQTLRVHVKDGFPKRPRHPQDSRKHPTLEEMAQLPDGLYRSTIPLAENLLPSIEIAGLSVKYYLDVSVSFGQDDLRARIPVRVL